MKNIDIRRVLKYMYTYKYTGEKKQKDKGDRNF